MQQKCAYYVLGPVMHSDLILRVLLSLVELDSFLVYVPLQIFQMLAQSFQHTDFPVIVFNFNLQLQH